MARRALLHAFLLWLYARECYMQIQVPARCLLPVDPGNCNGNWVYRWYFDRRLNRCARFNFSGCGGNVNNFLSIEQCRNACSVGRTVPRQSAYCSDPQKRYNSCGSACPVGCDNIGQGSRICTLQCVPGCYCRFNGHVFADSRNWRYSTCVPENQCYLVNNNPNNNLGVANTGISYNLDRRVGNIINQQTAIRQAIAVLSDQTGLNNVYGILQFIDQPRQNGVGGGGVRIRGDLRGLSPGSHGFTIHQYGDVSAQCLSTGNHFDPTNSRRHGSPTSSFRHAGDLGNIIVDQYGNARIDMYDRVISLYGVNSIVGRAVVIHERRDDLGQSGRPDGNAGRGLACGVIGISDQNRIIKR